MDLEKTLALIKPDAVHAGKAEEIKQLVELHGFTIIAEQKLQLTKARAEEFYGEHQGKPFFPRLVNFMTSGPVWAMVLAKPDAIKSWRALMGPTNVFTAREQAPRSLRALYGTDGTQNACHGSDSPASAEMEIKFYFPNLVLEPLLDSEDCQQYITDRIQPALGAALAELARQKPSAEQFEAITFLADYLLNHNPNKPKVVLPDAWDPSADAAHHIEASSDDEELFAQAAARAQAQDNIVTETAAPEPMAAAAHSPAAAAAADSGLVHKSLSSRSARDSKGAGGITDSAADTLIPSVTAQLPAGTSRQASAMSAASAAAAVVDTTPQMAMQKVTSGVGHDAGVSAAAAVAVACDGVTEEEPAADADAAATKVQAAFRGYQARKEVADMRREGPESTAEPVQSTTALDQLNVPVVVDNGTESVDTEVKDAVPSVIAPAASSSQAASAAGSRPTSAAPVQLPVQGSKPSTPPAAQTAHEESPVEEQSADVSEGAVPEPEHSDAVAAEPEQTSAEAAEPDAPVEEPDVSQPANVAEPDSEASHPVAVATEQSDAVVAAVDSTAAEEEQPPVADNGDDATPEISSATAEDTRAEAENNNGVMAVGAEKGLSILEATFARLDQDSSGYVDKEEFKAALAKLGTLKEELNERAERLVQAMDANGDTLVSRAEFINHLSWLQDVLEEPELVQFMEASFRTSPTAVKGEGLGEGHEGGEEGQQEYSPEQLAAVTRIQAAGRGMLVRKRVAGMKQGDATQQGDEEQTAAVVEEQNAAAAEATGDVPAHASGEYTPEASQADVGQTQADGECTPEASQAVADDGECTPEGSQAAVGDGAAAGGDSGEYTPEASQAAVGEGSEATRTTEEADEQ